MREINQKRLGYFEAVYEHRSIRRAADALNTAPSVITRQVALLEEELGVTLFERRPRGASPQPRSPHMSSNICADARPTASSWPQDYRRSSLWRKAPSGSLRARVLWTICLKRSWDPSAQRTSDFPWN